MRGKRIGNGPAFCFHCIRRIILITVTSFSPGKYSMTSILLEHSSVMGRGTATRSRKTRMLSWTRWANPTIHQSINRSIYYLFVFFLKKKERRH